MKIETFEHQIIDTTTGKTSTGGAVETRGRVSHSGNGCDLDGCHCSDQPFLSIAFPIENNTVKGVRVLFDNQQEYQSFCKGNDLYVNQE